MASTAKQQQMTVTDETVKAAEGLHKAMKGMGTDEKSLINILCTVSAGEVAQIVHAYKAHYDRDLAEDLEKEIKGDFKTLMMRIVKGEVESAVVDLHEALYPQKGGPQIEDIIEILTGRTNAEIKAINQAYQKKYNMPLVDACKAVLTGSFEKFICVILAAARDESNHNKDVNSDIEALFAAGTGKFGTDEDVFISMICNRGVKHLRDVFAAYEARYKMSVEKVIMKEFKGDVETGLVWMVRLIQNAPSAIARQLEDSMAGIGTRETKLARLVARYRDPAVMNVVEAEYAKQFGKPLVKRIQGETSGDFERALVAIVGRA